MNPALKKSCHKSSPVTHFAYLWVARGCANRLAEVCKVVGINVLDHVITQRVRLLQLRRYKSEHVLLMC